MNYYEHHLGDFMRDTAHLTMVEECAYRRLLDAYYIRERALPADHRDCCKLARAVSKQERDAVAYVLREFFELREDGHHQSRADREIERFRAKSDKARASIQTRWNRVREAPIEQRTNIERSTNVSSDGYERITDDIHRAPVPRHQTPVTNNPPTPRKRGSVHEFPPGFDAFWSAYPRKTAKTAAAKAFARLRPDERLLAAMLAAIERQRTSPQWTKDGGEFIPHPATWLNGRRWEDSTDIARAAGGGVFEGAV